jgi:hypothetical protein
MALGTCTLTEETFGTIKKVKWVWTVASSSASPAQAAAASRTTTHVYNGAIQRLVTIPDASSAPTASYDVTVMDQDSTDVLMGGGASRHSANTEQVLAVNLGVVAYDTLKLSIASTAASTAGTVIVYIR